MKIEIKDFWVNCKPGKGLFVDGKCVQILCMQVKKELPEKYAKYYKKGLHFQKMGDYYMIGIEYGDGGGTEMYQVTKQDVTEYGFDINGHDHQVIEIPGLKRNSNG